MLVYQKLFIYLSKIRVLTDVFGPSQCKDINLPSGGVYQIN